MIARESCGWIAPAIRRIRVCHALSRVYPQCPLDRRSPVSLCNTFTPEVSISRKNRRPYGFRRDRAFLIVCVSGIPREYGMSENEKILVIVEPDNHPHEVVDRAGWLAELTGCDLHLLLCDLDVGTLSRGVFVSNESRDLAQQIRTAQQELIDEIALDVRGRGIDVTTNVDGEIHLLHTYQRIAGIGREATKTFKPIRLPIDELSKKIQKEHREQLDSLAAANDIDGDHTHQLPGSTRDLLPTFARTHGADVVVMGALARWGLRRMIIGSTAEKVLDHLPCDILIVRLPEDESIQAVAI